MPLPTLAITGGTGFVGATLVRHAAMRGHHVRALTRKPQVSGSKIEWVEGSLDQPESLVRLAVGADTVIHVAGAINARDRAGFQSDNVFGTLNMVEAAKAAGVRRFIHVSSMAAREPELSDYGWSKARSEQIVGASGLDWTIVRPGGLTDEPGRGLVAVAPSLARRGTIARDDVAAVLAACLDEPRTVRAAFDLLQGETPIVQALAAL